MYPPPPPGSPPPPGYPPGYPPQQPYGYPPQGGYYVQMPVPMRPSRSGIPKVLGILAIIFSAFGLFGTLIWGLGPLSDVKKYHASDLDPIVTWLYVWMALSTVVFVLHLVGGILSVQYKPSGLKTLTWYAIAAIALIVLDAVLVNVLIPSKYQLDHSDDSVWFSVRTMHLVYSGMAVIWPIVALALARHPAAQAACNPSTAQQVRDVF